jgi:hypothetical protein
VREEQKDIGRLHTIDFEDERRGPEPGNAGIL